MKKIYYFATGLIAVELPFLLPETAFAASSGIAQVENFFKNVSGTLASFVGSVGVIILIIGGYMYMTASGSPEKRDKAKNTMKWAASGMVIVIGAIALANIIVSISKQSFGS